MDKDSYIEVVDEYNAMVTQVFDERGVHIEGVTPALATDTNRIILLVYSREVDAFLALKFAGRKDVKVNRYTVKEEKNV
jgi:hypothetical protein